MVNKFSFTDFIHRFANDEQCLEEIKKIRFPNGTTCGKCRRQTKYYKVKNRTAFACEFCGCQVYPLADTIFAKTTTPLRAWFYAMFLMIQTRANISIRQLQKELGVTYKTAWRIYKSIYFLMSQNDGDLLSKSNEKIRTWTFFNKIEITFVEKNKTTNLDS